MSSLDQNILPTTQRANVVIKYCHLFALGTWLHILSVSPNKVGKSVQPKEKKNGAGLWFLQKLLGIHRVQCGARKLSEHLSGSS